MPRIKGDRKQVCGRKPFLKPLIHLNVKKEDLVSKYICCPWFDTASMACIAKPLFQLSWAPKCPQLFVVWAGRMGVLIAHSWPCCADSFSAAGFQLLAALVVWKKQNQTAQLLSSDSKFLEILVLVYSFFAIERKTHVLFPLYLEHRHGLGLLSNNQLSLV